MTWQENRLSRQSLSYRVRYLYRHLCIFLSSTTHFKQSTLHKQVIAKVYLSHKSQHCSLVQHSLVLCVGALVLSPSAPATLRFLRVRAHTWPISTCREEATRKSRWHSRFVPGRSAGCTRAAAAGNKRAGLPMAYAHMLVVMCSDDRRVAAAAAVGCFLDAHNARALCIACSRMLGYCVCQHPRTANSSPSPLPACSRTAVRVSAYVSVMQPPSIRRDTQRRGAKSRHLCC